MKNRSAHQMVMDNLSELDDATEAMLIIVHSDGTIGWHKTSDVLHSNLGMLSYVQQCVEMDVRAAYMSEDEIPMND